MAVRENVLLLPHSTAFIYNLEQANNPPVRCTGLQKKGSEISGCHAGLKIEILPRNGESKAAV